MSASFRMDAAPISTNLAPSKRMARPYRCEQAGRTILEHTMIEPLADLSRLPLQ